MNIVSNVHHLTVVAGGIFTLFWVDDFKEGPFYGILVNPTKDCLTYYRMHSHLSTFTMAYWLYDHCNAVYIVKDTSKLA